MALADRAEEQGRSPDAYVRFRSRPLPVPFSFREACCLAEMTVGSRHTCVFRALSQHGI